MLNKDGVRQWKYGAPVQILANVEHQYSVGCRVPKTLAVDVDGHKVAKAGTPITIDLLDTSKNVVAATTTCNAVLLHNVLFDDVKDGAAANGTALVWGFVNLNRVETDVQTKLKAVTDAGSITILAL